VLRDLGHALRGRGRRHETHERERTATQPSLELRVGADWQVGHQQAVCARPCRTLRRVWARRQERVEVGEEDDRHVDARHVDQLERALERHAGLQGALRARLNDRAVGERVGERQAELDDVGAASRHASNELQRALAVGVPGGDVHDKRSAALCSQPCEALGEDVRRSSLRRECHIFPGPRS
jgi:hypothetical protein